MMIICNYSIINKSFHSIDYSKLTQKVITDKKGHTRKVWVRIDGNKQVAEPKKKVDNNSKMKIKSNLKTTSEIADYLESKLATMGFSVDTSASDLSGSRYITLTNYKEITGKTSKYNDEELKIRISDHDLPPSYDGLHGYHDIDIMSNDKTRPGNDGNADFYDNVLKRLDSIILPSVKQEQENRVKSERKENIKAKSELPDWAKDIQSLDEKLKTVASVDARLLLSSLKNEKSPAKRNEKIKYYIQELNKPENKELKELYKELF